MLNTSHKAQASPDTGRRMARAEAARHASLVRWKKESPLAATEDRARRAKDRAERAAERKRKATEKTKQRGPAAKKDAAMDDLTPIVSDMQATIAELTELAEPAIKAGRRNSGSDQAQLDQGYELAMQLCDLFESLGANTGEEEGEDEGEMGAAEEMEEMAGKALSSECQACMAACQACADACAGGDTDACVRACQTCMAACRACADACTPPTMQASMAACRACADACRACAVMCEAKGTNSAAAACQVCASACDACCGMCMGGMEGKAIDKRADVSPRAGVSEYGDVAFADAKNKKYPIDTPDHIRAAWNYISKPDNAGKYDPDEVAQIKQKIVAAWKQKIDKAGPPSAAETKKDAAYILNGDAIKSLDGDRVGAFAVRFGSAAEPDMSHMHDYFTKATDFWLDAWDRRPMLYHHAMDEDTLDAPRIGMWTKAEIKDEGVWLEGQLDRHHRYYSAIKELVRRGALRLSSDSAPHLVRRATKAGGVHEVTRWPLLAASLTPTPAEPRLTAVSFKALIAELGIDDTDNPEAHDSDAARPDAVKAADDTRARRLLLELDLLTLEATVT